MRCVFTVICLLLVAACASADFSDAWYRGATYCPVLDYRADPVYALGLSYVLPADVENGPRISFIEWDMTAELLYFRDVLLGDLDLRLDFRSLLPLQRKGLGIQDQLLVMAMDIRWTWRYVNDTALQLRAQPGLYSEIEALTPEALTAPLTFTGMRTFHPTLTALAGISVRHGFDRLLMPVGGVVWQPAASFRVEALSPESRMIWHITPMLSGHLGWLWESSTWRIPEDRFERKKITLESHRFLVGATRAFNEEFRVSAEMGVLTGRSLKFDRSPPDYAAGEDVDDAVFFRISAGGAF